MIDNVCDPLWPYWVKMVDRCDNWVHSDGLPGLISGALLEDNHFYIQRGVGSYYSSHLAETKIEILRADIAPHLPAFIADVEAVRASGLFREQSRTRDGIEFIAPRVRWDGAGTNDDGTSPAKTLINSYRDWTHDAIIFKKLVSSPELKAFDASWIAELEKFDYLGSADSAPIKEKIQAIPGMTSVERIGVHATLPFPYFQDFTAQASIYVLQKYGKNVATRRRALAHYAHAVRLIQSVQNVVAQMSAVAILRREIALSENARTTRPNRSHK